MNIDKLNRANYLRGVISSLNYVIQDLENRGYDGICAWTSNTKYHSEYGHVIKDTELVEEVKQLIKDKLKKYQKEFEEL
jgi:hypothetical protein